MPSNNLLGITTPCGWQITDKISTKQESGGNFCCRYLAKNSEGKVAFLKAMDLTRAFNSTDVLQSLNKLTSEYLFERDILYFCKDKDLSNVVVPLDAGKLQNPGYAPPLNEVFYIVFEKAESDMRQMFLASSVKSWRGLFRALQHVCNGLEQLHMAGIAHQDVKPSNILHFENFQSKIADLGRVTDKAGKSPFLNFQFPGDRTYAPIEVRYGFTVTEFHDRYLTDIHSIGSLIYQIIMGTSMTAALSSESILLNINVFNVSYRDALPVHLTAFSTLMSRLKAQCQLIFNEEIADAITSTVIEMCHPNLNLRGSPKIHKRPLKINMRRYVSKMAEIHRKLIIRGIN
jgi:serine/threonine protein kinase